MKSILFSHSYFLRFDPKQWATGQPYAPLGTLYAASLLRENGFDVSLFDTMFSETPQDLSAALEEKQPSVFVLYDDGFNYLTKMCLTNMRDAAFSMIKIAKEFGCTVIVSSSDSTDHFEQYLEQGADIILLGEAEYSLLEVVQFLREGRDDFSAIPGVVFRREDCIVKTVKRTVTKDLDAFPLPAWDLVDMQPYKKMWMEHAGYFSINVATTRGCPFKCNWCAKPIYGNRYNSRSPRNVVDELVMLKNQFGFDHIWFCDDIFGLKPGWMENFAALVRQTSLQLRFKIQSRADLLLQENYLADLALAGCDNIWMGAESGSQKILDAMDKGITVDQIEMATLLARRFGIKPSFFIQFGYPGETKDDIIKTIRMINHLLPHEIGISVSYPLPGTVFFENVKKDLAQKTNWTDSDELALMFRNTYQPAFYKQLHRYVHKSYRMHIAMYCLRSIILQPVRMHWSVLKKALSGIYYAPATLIAGLKLKQLERN